MEKVRKNVNCKGCNYRFSIDQIHCPACNQHVAKMDNKRWRQYTPVPVVSKGVAPTEKMVNYQDIKEAMLSLIPERQMVVQAPRRPVLIEKTSKKIKKNIIGSLLVLVLAFLISLYSFGMALVGVSPGVVVLVFFGAAIMGVASFVWLIASKLVGYYYHG